MCNSFTRDSTISVSASVKVVEGTPEHVEHLCGQLNLPPDYLLPEETGRLKALVTEFSNVIALSDSDLGCTYVPRHFINTGDHPPTKQQPYWTSVVRCEKVSQMIDNMEKLE